MTDDALIRFFQFSWILLSIGGIFPLYLSRGNLKSRINSLRITIIFALYAVFGIFMQQNLERGVVKFTENEFVIILSLTTVGIVSIILPLVIEQCEVVYEQNLSIRPKRSRAVLDESFKKIRGKIIRDNEFQEFTATIKAGYGNEFKIDIKIDDSEEARITYSSLPHGLSLMRFRILFALTAYPIIFSLGYDSFDVTIPIFERSIDAEVLFFILFTILIFFLILLIAVQRNFFFELEEIQKNTIKEMAQKSLKEPSSRKLSLTKPDFKTDIDAAKKRAEQIREKNVNLALEERRKKVKDRVDGVLGKKESEEEEGLDPELIRNQIIISKVKTILKSTPIAMDISLKDIAQKCNYEDIDHIEKIIIGLIDRNEVRGRYDIWKGLYVVGDVSSQFIEKTLRNLDLSTEDLEYIKLSKQGDIEIRINGDKKSVSIKKEKKD